MIAFPPSSGLRAVRLTKRLLVAIEGWEKVGKEEDARKEQRKSGRKMSVLTEDLGAQVFALTCRRIVRNWYLG